MPVAAGKGQRFGRILTLRRLDSTAAAVNPSGAHLDEVGGTDAAALRNSTRAAFKCEACRYLRDLAMRWLGHLHVLNDPAYIRWLPAGALSVRPAFCRD